MSNKRISGIYKITNILNNKVYIGSGVCVSDRLSAHKSLLNRNKHFNLHLQASWNKYEENSFTFELIEECSLQDLEKREEYNIKLYKANNRLYGFNKRINCKTNLGIKLSLETREKLRLSHLGHKRSKEAQEKISASQYKRVCQMDLLGNLINTFNSMQEAEKETNTYKQSISACCRKKLRKSNNFLWCYEKEFNSFKLPPERKNRWRKTNTEIST